MPVRKKIFVLRQENGGIYGLQCMAYALYEPTHRYSHAKERVGQSFWYISFEVCMWPNGGKKSLDVIGWKKGVLNNKTYFCLA